MVQVFTVAAINMKKTEAERQSGTLGINLPKSQSTFFLFFGCTGSSLLHRLSLVAASGATFGCDPQAPHWGGFSCLVAEHGL